MTGRKLDADEELARRKLEVEEARAEGTEIGKLARRGNLEN